MWDCPVCYGEKEYCDECYEKELKAIKKGMIIMAKIEQMYFRKNNKTAGKITQPNHNANRQLTLK
jgi:hypothetical protein